jgi:La-related protein 7
MKDNDIKTKKIKTAEDQNVIDQQNNSCNIEKSNIENDETSSKNNNHNKIIGKKRRKVTINDENIVEDIDKKKIKKDTHELAIKSDNEKRKEMKDLNNSDEVDAVLQTEKYSTMNNDTEEKEISEERQNEGKKKKRKRNRNKIHEQDIICNMGLQIMAKLDWKRLRNRYLELQRSKMKLLKQHLKKAEVGRGEIIIKKRANYDKSKREKDNGRTNETEKSIYGCVNYASGIIVKVEMDEPCTDSRSFKVCLKVLLKILKCFIKDALQYIKYCIYKCIKYY